MPRWVDHDAPPIRPWLMLSWDRAQIDSPRDVVFQIAGGHVEMDLLLLQAIRPSRWPMRLHPQKADQATSPLKAIADRSRVAPASCRPRSRR